MKKEQSIINKEQFFSGKLTEDQEKKLIHDDEDSFFETLREEKDVKMDFSFDDFMSKVEEPKPPISKESNSNVFSLWKISGIAASFLLLIGVVYFITQNNATPNDLQVVKSNSKKIVEKEVKTNENLVVEKKPVVEKIVEKSDYPIVKNLLAHQKITEKNHEVKSKITKKVENIENEPSSDLVILNGESVKNEEEATLLALNTMKIFTENINEGVEAIGKLKSLQVEL